MSHTACTNTQAVLAFLYTVVRHYYAWERCLGGLVCMYIRTGADKKYSGVLGFDGLGFWMPVDVNLI